MAPAKVSRLCTISEAQASGGRPRWGRQHPPSVAFGGFVIPASAEIRQASDEGHPWQMRLSLRREGGEALGRGGGGYSLSVLIPESLPLVGKEDVELLGGVGPDPVEEIAKVLEGTDLMTLGSRDEAIEDGGRSAAAVAAEEGPVLATLLEFVWVP